MAGSGANFQQDVVRYRGDTFPEEFRLVDNTGTPIDITGRSFVLTVNPAEAPVDDTNDLYALTATITDAEAGLYEFPISALQADAAAGDYFFNIKMTYNPGSGNVVKTIGGGEWEIKQGIGS